MGDEMGKERKVGEHLRLGHFYRGRDGRRLIESFQVVL